MEDYLVPTGVLKKDQIDGSYDGTPANFVPSGGKVAQQGFASAEPYIYQNEITEWGKPVKFQLIHDTGYPIYSQAISVRAGDLPDADALLEEAGADHAAGHRRLREEPGQDRTPSSWSWSRSTTTAGCTARAWPTTRSRRCSTSASSATGPDKTLGNMEPDRIQKIIDIVGPALAKVGKARSRPA